MERNQVRTFKDLIFRAFSPIEAIFAYNRMRREAWVTKQAQAIPKGSKVLDVGAGGCPHRTKFTHCEYFTQDFAQLSETQIQTQDGYGEIDIICDILDIPVADSSYDVVLCTEVLEHVPEPIAALKEFARILRPGGTLLITAPLLSGLHQEPYHYYGGYTKHWYKKFITSNNFVELTIEPNGSLHTTYFALGATIVKTFLETLIVHDSTILERTLALFSLVIFSPIFLLVNPIFCFAWEKIYQNADYTAGYHVSAKKI